MFKIYCMYSMPSTKLYCYTEKIHDLDKIIESIFLWMTDVFDLKMLEITLIHLSAATLGMCTTDESESNRVLKTTSFG